MPGTSHTSARSARSSSTTRLTCGATCAYTPARSPSPATSAARASSGRTAWSSTPTRTRRRRPMSSAAPAPGSCDSRPPPSPLIVNFIAGRPPRLAAAAATVLIHRERDELYLDREKNNLAISKNVYKKTYIYRERLSGKNCEILFRKKKQYIYKMLKNIASTILYSYSNDAIILCSRLIMILFYIYCNEITAICCHFCQLKISVVLF
jgi:hypothetical protein